MRKLNVAICVGCFERKNSKDGSIYYVSHFIYDYDEHNQAVFTAYDKCNKGDTYQFVYSNGKATLIEE